MSNVRFVLRDLPGVHDLEALIENIENHPNPNWAPETDSLKPLTDRVSRLLFGITQEETEFESGGECFDMEEWSHRYNEWEDHFAFILTWDWEEVSYEEFRAAEVATWKTLGWDVLGRDGEPHRALGLLARQMLCATKGLRGRLPDAEMSEAEARESAERWATELLRR